MNLTEQKRDEIIRAAYEWRAAVVHAAACRLKIRDGNIGDAEADEKDKSGTLMIILDHYHPDLTTLDYVVEL